jgi:hypothetical protein
MHFNDGDVLLLQARTPPAVGSAIETHILATYWPGVAHAGATHDISWHVDICQTLPFQATSSPSSATGRGKRQIGLHPRSPGRKLPPRLLRR